MKNYIVRLLKLMTPVILFSSCASYMVSPLNTTSNPYMPMPVKTKNAPAVTERYAGFHLSPGAIVVNDGFEDHFNSATVRVVQSHAFNSFRAAYSVNLGMGSYKVATSDYVSGPEQIYRMNKGGNLFFGNAGIAAAISYAIPLRSGTGEWRVIGLQGSAFGEFGEFYEFRKNYPNVDDNYVNRRALTYTAGLFTEFAKVKKSGKRFGFKFGLSFNTLQQMFYAYDNDKMDANKPNELPHYFSFASFMGKGNVTGFIQANAGTAVLNAQLGVLFRLNKPKGN